MHSSGSVTLSATNIKNIQDVEDFRRRLMEFKQLYKSFLIDAVKVRFAECSKKATTFYKKHQNDNGKVSRVIASHTDPKNNLILNSSH